MCIVELCMIYSLLVMVSACRNCSNYAFTQIQFLCVDSINRFELAEIQYTNYNQQNLCRYLYDYYYCVGENVPECLQILTVFYQQYHFTPWDCHPDTNVTLKLQMLVLQENDCMSNNKRSSKPAPNIDIANLNKVKLQPCSDRNKEESFGHNSATVWSFGQEMLAVLYIVITISLGIV